MKKVKDLSHFIEIIFIIFVVLLCSIVLCQKFFSKNHSFFGYRVFTIVTGSMDPELKIGDIVLVKSTKFDKIKIGDYLTFNGVSEELKDKVVTHEVVDILKENDNYVFYTKGIKSDLVDPAVYEEQIYGVVTYKFVVLSFIHKIITNIFGFIICIILPLIYVLITEIKTIIKEKKMAVEFSKIDKEK